MTSKPFIPSFVQSPRYRINQNAIDDSLCTLFRPLWKVLDRISNPFEIFGISTTKFSFIFIKAPNYAFTFFQTFYSLAFLKYSPFQFFFHLFTFYFKLQRHILTICNFNNLILKLNLILWYLLHGFPSTWLVNYFLFSIF